MPLALIRRRDMVVIAGEWPTVTTTGPTFTVPYEGAPPAVGTTRWTGTAFETFDPPRPITKLALYDRMTDGELEALENFLQTLATRRQRLRWADAQEINRNDPEVRAMAEALYGLPRALELLA